jgi:hypothetical protein
MDCIFFVDKNIYGVYVYFLFDLSDAGMGQEETRAI